MDDQIQYLDAQEANVSKTLGLAHLDLDEIRCKQRIEQNGLHEKKRSIYETENQYRDKHVSFDRIMDKSHTLNNQIDFELRTKDQLVQSIKMLEE